MMHNRCVHLQFQLPTTSSQFLRKRFNIHTHISIMYSSQLRLVTGCFLVSSIILGSSAFENENDGKTDVCGDPLPTDDMQANPLGVIDWLRNQAMFQQVNNVLDQHPFVKDAEDGKLSQEAMQRFIVNTAYANGRELRSMHAAIDAFGYGYPVPEEMNVLQFQVVALQQGHENLMRLAAKFGIDDTAALLRNEPDHHALQGVNAKCEAVAHAMDVSEVIAPDIAIMDNDNGLLQRIRNALAKNPAYKAWNLSEEDLRYFDEYVNIDMKRLDEMVAPVIRSSIQRQATLCELRRRTDAINIGRLAFFDAVQRGIVPPTGDYEKFPIHTRA